jgi:6-phosphogluconolactonase
MYQEHPPLSRREWIMSGAAVLAAPALSGCQSMHTNAMTPARAQFAYAGAYTVRAPGGRSARADAAPAAGITVFAVNADNGALTPLQTVPSTNPAHMALNAAQTRLYAINEIADFGGAANTGSIEAYAIDASSGLLSLINRQPIGPIPAHFSIAPDGRHLVVASYVGGRFHLLPIAPDGSLGPIADELHQSGSGPHARQQSPHPHMAHYLGDGKFIGTTDLGTDRVEILAVESGRLQRVSGINLPPGSGPRHLAFNAGSGMICVINELVATITAIRFDAQSGRLGPVLHTAGTVPPDFPAHKSTAAILVHPNGRFLYGSNRKFENHPLADSVVAFDISDPRRAPRLIGHVTHDLAFPRTMSIDPSGNWLYVLNQKGDSIVQFAIDPASGALRPTGRSTAITTPAGLVFRTA